MFLFIDFYNEEESALESTDDYAEWREKIQRSLGEELKLITEMRARKGQLSDSENERQVFAYYIISMSSIS